MYGLILFAVLGAPPEQAPRPPQAPELPQRHEKHVEKPAANVPPACCCAVGDACSCAPGHCHCASAQWHEVEGVTVRQLALVKNGKQVGSYRYDTGVFLPMKDGAWADKPCKCPKALPFNPSVPIGHPHSPVPQSTATPFYQSASPLSPFPAMGRVRSTGGC